MSKSRSTRSSPFRRDNHFGETADDKQQSSGASDAREDPNSPIKHLAHSILRADADALCATTLQEKPYNGGQLAELVAWLVDDECIDGRADAMHHQNRAVELTEPTFYVPPGDGTERGRKARLNEETGYITGGETTSVVYRDRPADEFLATVDAYLDMIRQRIRERPSTFLDESDLDDARHIAKSWKHAGDTSDVEIMKAIVRRIRRGQVP